MNRRLVLVTWTGLMFAMGCGGDSADDDTTAADDDDTTATDDDDTTAADDDDATAADDDDTILDGDRTVSGRAYFFDASGVGQIEELDDVEGAEIYLLEYPAQRRSVGPDGLFTFDGLPDHREITLGLEHPDFFPSFTATLSVGEEDLEGITFQAVTWAIAEFLGLMLGLDAHDTSVCSMVVTVTAMGENQDSVYAPGEPGVVVTLDPAVPAENGPVYFNTSVVPDTDLTETTSDGGVIVAGVEPGRYTWYASKDGLEFEPLELRCVGGALTNGSPPYGLQAALAAATGS